jgi:hypothetical protein
LRAAQNAPETAARWLDRFHVALQTLASNPERCVLAPENEIVDQGIPKWNRGCTGGLTPHRSPDWYLSSENKIRCSLARGTSLR